MLEALERVIVPEEAIRARVAALAREIEEACPEEELIFLAIINGALMFTADLIRQIDRCVLLDCIRVSSYRDSTTAVHEPRILDNICIDVSGKPVVIIDDILDTGKTLSHVVQLLKGRDASSIRTCVLLDKRERREVEFKSDFVGFTIPDEFVVGYGLDFAERYRQLPCIGVLKPEYQNPPEWV